jgi:hypothetical protein
MFAVLVYGIEFSALPQSVIMALLLALLLQLLAAKKLRGFNWCQEVSFTFSSVAVLLIVAYVTIAFQKFFFVGGEEAWGAAFGAGQVLVIYCLPLVTISLIFKVASDWTIRDSQSRR